MKEFNILSAKPTGGEPDQHGNVSFWLEIEGEGSALVLRKPSSPFLSGPTWGELTNATSTAGKAYKRFKVGQRPDGNIPATGNFVSGQRQFKADPDKQASIEWQSALKTAAEIVKDYKTLGALMVAGPVVTTLDDYTYDVVNVATRLAKVIETQPDPETTEVVNDDLPPVENYDELDSLTNEIPF